jgi:hypothetical protein
VGTGLGPVLGPAAAVFTIFVKVFCLVELTGLESVTPACKERAGCGIALLTWHYPLCKIGCRGRKSHVVVVRTVVSVHWPAPATRE